MIFSDDVPYPRRQNRGACWVIKLRARLLTATTIHCANGGLAPGMFLSARAHWEMTGLVAHLLIALRRFYKGDLQEGDLETILRQLALGRK